MSGMELFATRSRANEGKRLELRTPDGKATDHWLQVRHVWSDAFQEAEDSIMSGVREDVLAAEGDSAKVAKIKRDAQERLWASLVIDWSFDSECTPDAVAAFLHDAPQIGKVLDKYCADSRHFFANDSDSLNAGSSQSEN